VKTKYSKENVSNMEREVIWLMIVKERRMERRTKSLINLNQTNPNQEVHKALNLLIFDIYENVWYFDLGASRYATPHSDWFIEYTPMSNRK
jgi:hypothetical protein